MEISYQLTIDDYRQGFHAYRKRTSTARWTYRFLHALFALVLATALLMSFQPVRSFSTLFPLWALAVLWSFALWYHPYHIARKMIKGSRAAALPRTTEINEAGIYVRSAATESRLTWETIVDWVEMERVFTLFLSPVSFFPIPKRAMTEAQQNEFRALLQSKVKS